MFLLFTIVSVTLIVSYYVYLQYNAYYPELCASSNGTSPTYSIYSLVHPHGPVHLNGKA